MDSARVTPQRRPHIQVHWDRIYVLTLVLCFWVGVGEIAYFLL